MSLQAQNLKIKFEQKLVERLQKQIKIRIDAIKNFDKEMPMSLRIERFQRNNLMKGLKPVRDQEQKE